MVFIKYRNPKPNLNLLVNINNLAPKVKLMKYPSYIIYYGLILFILALSSCGKTPEIQNFDSELWKNDRKGCKGDRAKLYQSLLSQQELIKGAGEMYLLPLLGSPDRISLGSRNLRNYTYFIDSGKQCDTSKKNNGASITIYFNATNLANEVQYHPKSPN